MLQARRDSLTVRASDPLAWTLIEVGPLGQLRLLSADSLGPLSAQRTIPLSSAAARNGRLSAPGPAPRWSAPCAAEGNEVAVDAQTGLRLYVGPECLRTGSGRAEPPPSAARSGYWLVFGSAARPTGPALRRMLQTLRPVPNPAALAPLVARALFGATAVGYDYAVVPIPQ